MSHDPADFQLSSEPAVTVENGQPGSLALALGWAPSLLLGDCLKRMAEIPDGSVDMVLCDLPYGTTACKWDSVIPFEPLWAHYRRVCKRNAAIVLTASQPFTSALVMSNANEYRCAWVWAKGKAGNFAIAKTQPLRVTEDILVFSRERHTYNPQMTQAKKENMRPRNKGYRQAENGINQRIASGLFVCSENHREDLRHPTNLLDFKSTEGECNNVNRVHPTQKPVALMEYLIRTYTKEGETVLDNTMGSGTTGVACARAGRRFIGIERDEAYFTIARQRIEEAYAALPLFSALPNAASEPCPPPANQPLKNHE